MPMNYRGNHVTCNKGADDVGIDLINRAFTAWCRSVVRSVN
jgi:hypothetical protein